MQSGEQEQENYQICINGYELFLTTPSEFCRFENIENFSQNHCGYAVISDIA